MTRARRVRSTSRVSSTLTSRMRVLASSTTLRKPGECCLWCELLAIELSDCLCGRRSRFLRASCDLLGLLHDTKNVFAGEFPQIVVRPPAVCELRKECGIFRDILETDNDVCDSVEISADPHVVRSDDFLDVFDLIGDLRQSRFRRGMLGASRAHCLPNGSGVGAQFLARLGGE